MDRPYSSIEKATSSWFLLPNKLFNITTNVGLVIDVRLDSPEVWIVGTVRWMLGAVDGLVACVHSPVHLLWIVPS